MPVLNDERELRISKKSQKSVYSRNNLSRKKVRSSDYNSHWSIDIGDDNYADINLHLFSNANFNFKSVASSRLRDDCRSLLQLNVTPNGRIAIMMKNSLGTV